MSELPQNIIQARQEAQSAAGQYGQLAAQKPAISDVLKQKALDLYQNNQDIIQPLDTATQAYMSAPSVGREKYQDIFNPFTREKLVSQYVGNQALPMLSLSSILGQRMGRFEDLMGAGTNAYTAMTTGQQLEAQNKRQLYEDLLNEYKTTEELALSREKANKDAGGLSADFWKLITLANPNPTQEKTANDAISGLTNIQTLRQMFKKNSNLPKLLGMGNVGLILSGGQTSEASKHLKSLQDIITRIRTGAALNKEEESFYQNLILDPIQTVFYGPGGTEESFKILEDIFNKAVTSGKNKYQPFLDLYGSSLLGGGVSDDGFIPD